MRARKVFPEVMPAPLALIYHLLPGVWLRRVHRELARRMSPRKGKLLDIGCGPGDLVMALRESNPKAHIVGIDVSPQMVRIARRRCLDAQRVEFKVMDANGMSFACDSFDFVTSTWALHHWQSPRQVFDEIYRVLKPGCEAWIYDGLAEVAVGEIRRWMQPFPGVPPAWFYKLMFRVHGFSAADYEGGIKREAEASLFGGCRFEHEMVLMKTVLSKPARAKR